VSTHVSDSAVAASEPTVAERDGPQPAAGPTPATSKEAIGTVGSPSTTGEVTVDLLDEAIDKTLLGGLVYLTHPVSHGRHLLAIGTVSDIETRNRWHEDPNMRGVLKQHGSLPHLSGVGDTRTASVVVQAVYDTAGAHPPFADPPRESGGKLGMSPTTGTPVRRVNNTVVRDLITRHAGEVVYLGHVYRTNVRLPMFVRDFTSEKTDGAYHTGIFGRSGSGKSALALHLLAAQLRHSNLGMLVFDPQGQFASEIDFPFSLRDWAGQLGRRIRVFSIAEQIQLPADTGLCVELLQGSTFFRQLTVKAAEIRETAADELGRLLRAIDNWQDQPARDVLRSLLTALLADTAALNRIYNSPTPRNRLIGALQRTLDDAGEFNQLLLLFTPIHNLFSAKNLNEQNRTPLWPLLQQLLHPANQQKPVIILDLSGSSGSSWLDSTETKARLIRKIASELRRNAERTWRETRKAINCLVVFDEAHRFAAAHPEGDQAEMLSSRLVEYVRATRKFGLGWTFITQEIHALAPGIYNQLRVKVFGYGLTTGTDLVRLTDEVGRGAALELYKSFADPRALDIKVYPFMLTGPVSPLSFTGQPVFLEVFTSFEDFVETNLNIFPRIQTRLSL
jgi:Helicase HerA, central domain